MRTTDDMLAEFEQQTLEAGQRRRRVPSCQAYVEAVRQSTLLAAQKICNFTYGLKRGSFSGCVSMYIAILVWSDVWIYGLV
jgi:hypothetical protein